MPQLPFRRWAILRTLNRACGSYLVNRAMRSLQLKRPIAWFVVPHAADLAGCLAEDLIVYYCTDDYASMPNVDSHEVARMDEDLTRRADQVFVTSATLLDRKRQLNPNVEHAPHGVDVDLFRRAAEPETPTANAACGLKRPVIGFFGLIEAWIDLDLIAFLARNGRPGVSCSSAGWP